MHILKLIRTLLAAALFIPVCSGLCCGDGIPVRGDGIADLEGDSHFELRVPGYGNYYLPTFRSGTASGSCAVGLLCEVHGGWSGPVNMVGLEDGYPYVGRLDISFDLVSTSPFVDFSTLLLLAGPLSGTLDLWDNPDCRPSCSVVTSMDITGAADGWAAFRAWPVPSVTGVALSFTGTAVVVPELPSFLLLGTGFVGLAGTIRRGPKR